jgi:hypothetical protein
MKKNTVKSNLNILIKTYYITLKEIENRSASKEVKINELRKLSDQLEGTVAVIQHTGSYIEELSLLLDIRRESYSILQKFL